MTFRYPSISLDDWIHVSWLCSLRFYSDWFDVTSDVNSWTEQQANEVKRVDSTRVCISNFFWRVSFPDEMSLFLSIFPFLFILHEVLQENILSCSYFSQKFSIICRQAVFEGLVWIISYPCMPSCYPSTISALFAWYLYTLQLSLKYFAWYLLLEKYYHMLLSWSILYLPSEAVVLPKGFPRP